MIIEEINKYVYITVDQQTLDLTIRVVEKTDEIIINL